MVFPNSSFIRILRTQSTANFTLSNCLTGPLHASQKRFLKKKYVHPLFILSYQCATFLTIYFEARSSVNVTSTSLKSISFKGSIPPHCNEWRLYSGYKTKNPTYGRQRISRPMRIVAPFLLLRFRCATKGALSQQKNGEGGGGLTNEKPGTYHVIWGPMRGLKINYMIRGHINISTNIAMKESAKWSILWNKNNLWWFQTFPSSLCFWTSKTYIKHLYILDTIKECLPAHLLQAHHANRANHQDNPHYIQ